MKKRLPKAETKPVDAPKTLTLSPDPHPVWKKLFFGSTILGLVILLFAGYNVGFHSDELDVNAYGKGVFKYYTSGGKDSSYLNPGVEDSLRVNTRVMKSYGTLFELMVRPVLAASGADYEINIRHIFIQVLAILSMFLAGLLCFRLTGSYRASFIAFWLIFLTPIYFGHSMFNPKDIPFAFGYILALYMMVVWLQQWPALKWKTTLLLGLCIGAAISFRIGGLVLFPLLLFMVLWRFVAEKQVRKVLLGAPLKHLLHLAVVVLVGLGVTVLLSPFIMQAPLENFMYAVGVVSKFPQIIPLLFKGKEYNSVDVPADFIPHWIAISVPVVILVLLASSVIFLALNNRKIPQVKLVILLLIAAALPVVIAIAQSMALYSGWRHMLFIYPLLMVFATYWLSYGLQGNKLVRFGFPALLLLGMAHPIYWSIKNHPYQYTYFNELSDGFHKNYYRYETDYWDMGIKNTLDWMMKSPDIKKGKDITIATTSPEVVRYLMKHYYHDTLTHIALANVANHNLRKWDYCLLGPTMTRLYVLKQSYPPYGTIHSTKVDGRVITAVVSDTNRWDYRGRMALEKGQFAVGDSLLSLHLSVDPNAETIVLTKVMADAALGRIDAVHDKCLAAIAKYPDDYMFYYYLGITQAYRGEKDNSIANIETAYKNGIPADATSLNCLINMYAAKGNMPAAEHYKKILRNLPRP